MGKRINSCLAWLSWFYIGGLFGWAALRAFFGDRWWWLFFLNSFAEYLFALLPAVCASAWLARQRRLWLGFCAALALNGYLYDWMRWPKLLPVQVSDVTLTVMTFNMLGYNRRPEGVVGAIRDAGADIVVVQEVNIATAT